LDSLLLLEKEKGLTLSQLEEKVKLEKELDF
jgi:hypothetical protein